MHLTLLKIEKFKGFDTLEIEFDREITVLVGENNCGKTSVLEALRFGLEKIKSSDTCNFTDHDYF